MSAINGIAKLWKPVVNVTDLAEGEKFWSALTGLTPSGRHGDESGDVFSVLDDPDEPFWLLLQLVPGDQATWVGGTHLDLRVADVAEAVRRTLEIGGAAIRPPALYPAAESPLLQWAVMQDPFGNEFCFVKWPLTTSP